MVMSWLLLQCAVTLVVLSAHLAHGDVSVVTNKQPAVTYDSMEAVFGASLPKHGFMGMLQTTVPDQACSPVAKPHSVVTNGSQPAYIAVIERGSPDKRECEFATKVYNAQQAGFSAVIIFNNEQSSLVHMDTDNDTLADLVKISSVFVSKDSGDSIKTGIFQGPTFATLYPDPMPQWPSFLVTFIVIIACFLFMFTIFMFYRQRTRFHATRVERLSTEEVMKLPTRVQGPLDPEAELDTCCICLGEYEEGDVQIVLPCNHFFHKDCIEPWLIRRRRTCPMCKRDPLATERTPLLGPSVSSSSVSSSSAASLSDGGVTVN
eukprot:m.476254 g.476254  ORF g.476254 m.476254 type:complete len:319 (+) comp20483_c0_seq1:707-1663(+)